MERRVLEEVILRAGGSVAKGDTKRAITKVDLFEWGFSGGDDSADRRKELCRKLGLPIKISVNSLLEILNVLYTYEEFCEKI
jgi:ribonuclease M5